MFNVGDIVRLVRPREKANTNIGQLGRVIEDQPNDEGESNEFDIRVKVYFNEDATWFYDEIELISSALPPTMNGLEPLVGQLEPGVYLGWAPDRLEFYDDYSFAISSRGKRQRVEKPFSSGNFCMFTRVNMQTWTKSVIDGKFHFDSNKPVFALRLGELREKKDVIEWHSENKLFGLS